MGYFAIISLYLVFASFIGFSEAADTSEVYNILSPHRCTRIAPVIFHTKPYDYEVDFPVWEHGRLPARVLKFNLHFTNFSSEFVYHLERNYFKLILALYPGLKGVPIYPFDVENLILFGILYTGDEYPCEFPSHVENLSKALGESQSQVVRFFTKYSNELGQLQKTALMRQLFERAVHQNSFYTVEAFFATGIERFTIANVLLVFESNRNSGDSRLLRRIFSKLDVCSRIEFLKASVSMQGWPTYSGKLQSKLSSEKFSLITAFDCDMRRKDFKAIKDLGQGAFGSCVLITSLSTGNNYALKCIKKSECLKSLSQLEKLRHEVIIQQSLSHAGIVKLYRTFEDDHYVYLMMELCQRSMKGLRLSEVQARDFLNQVLPAIEYMHSNGIVHRDIKVENLLVQEPGFRIKIADFGVSAIIHGPEEKLNGLIGTHASMAPEMFGEAGYGFEVDIWALGVALFYLLTGKRPFVGYTKEGREKGIKAVRYTFPNEPELSDEVKDLIQRILVANVGMRISIIEMFSHPFLRVEQEDAQGFLNTCRCFPRIWSRHK